MQETQLVINMTRLLDAFTQSQKQIRNTENLINYYLKKGCHSFSAFSRGTVYQNYHTELKEYENLSTLIAIVVLNDYELNRNIYQ